MITRLFDQSQPLDDDALADLYAPPDGPATWLRVNAVTSLDGAGVVDGLSGGLSSPADQHLMSLLRMRCDALLVGAGTLRSEGYGPLRLPERQRAWRRRQGLPEQPTLVVVSGALDLSPAHPALAEAPTRPVVLAPSAAPAARRAALAVAADILVAGADAVDFAAGLPQLHQRGLRHILCEGGPRVLAALTAADLVDELCLTVSPALAGAGGGRITAGAGSPLRRMSLCHVLVGDETLFLRYRRKRVPARGASGTPR